MGAELWSPCHVLGDDSVTYHHYLSELTYLLLLKRIALRVLQQVHQDTRERSP